MKTMRRCLAQLARCGQGSRLSRPGQAEARPEQATIWWLCLSRKRISCLSVVDYVEKRAEWKSARGLGLMIRPRPGRGRADI